MKQNTLFVLLFLSLITTTAFAQKRLSPGLRPYAENWTFTVVKSLHRAGFDMPTMAAVPVAPTQAANTLRLDSTKTFFQYNLNASGDSTPIFRSTCTYPQPNTKVETNFQYNNGQWQAINRSIISSDALQRLVGIESEAFDPENLTLKPDSRLEIFPHGDSPELVDSFFMYLWDSTAQDWRLMLANRNYFDAQGRLLESISTLDYSGDRLIFKEVYGYDTNGDNDLIEEFTLSGSTISSSSRTDIKYVNHLPLEILVSHSDGFSFLPVSRTNYAYTLFNALRKQMNFEWNTAGQYWILVQTTDYAYDSAQRLSFKETARNTQETREIITFAYSANHNLYLEMVLNWDDDLFDWVLDSKKYHYYSGFVSVDPNPVAVSALEISPNPTVGLVRLDLDRTARIQIYDTNGTMVSSGEYQPDQMLQLNDLPSGLYFIAAQSADQVYAGKIVKQ